jgi:hypothetical protein
MPELQELGASHDLPLTVEHVKVDVPATLSLREQSNVAPTPISPSSPHCPNALVAEEICVLFSRFDVLVPKLGRSIACLLTGHQSRKKLRR